jgi:adenylate cyclase
MTKIINSLQTQLIVSFVLLIVLIAGGTFIFTYGQTKKALLDSTRDDLLQVIGLVSTQFTNQEIDQVSQFKAGQENSPEYLAFVEKLRGMRAISPNLINLYIMQVKGDQVIFLVDDVAEDPSKIEQVYEQPEARLFEAVNAPSVSDDIYTDEWGTFLSAYAPVKKAKGETAFLVGVDMLATQVIDRQNFIGNTIYIVMGLGILIVAIIIGFFSLTIIRDINKLNKAAELISMGDTNVSVDVHRKDEIGELADSFVRMVASLKIMMSVDVSQDETSGSLVEKASL